MASPIYLHSPALVNQIEYYRTAFTKISIDLDRRERGEPSLEDDEEQDDSASSSSSSGSDTNSIWSQDTDDDAHDHGLAHLFAPLQPLPPNYIPVSIIYHAYDDRKEKRSAVYTVCKTRSWPWNRLMFVIQMLGWEDEFTPEWLQRMRSVTICDCVGVDGDEGEEDEEGEEELDEEGNEDEEKKDLNENHEFNQTEKTEFYDETDDWDTYESEGRDELGRCYACSTAPRFAPS